MTLREKIANAFPKEGAPKYRLSDAIIEDDYGSDHYAFTEEWKTWDEVENWQIVKSDVFFSYAPLEAAIYLLPRFMLFVLDEIEGRLEDQYQGFGAGDTAVWFIQRMKNTDFRGTQLTSEQKLVLDEFLSFIYKDYDYRVTLEVGED